MKKNQNIITVYSQEQVYDIPSDYAGNIFVEFGTADMPAQLSGSPLITWLISGEWHCQIYSGNAKILENAHADVFGCAFVMAYGNTYVKATNNARVFAFENAHVLAFEKSCIKGTGRSLIQLFGESFAELEGYATAFCAEHSSVKLFDESKGFLSPTATLLEKREFAYAYSL